MYDNFFFRKCMPYMVECTDDSILVKNREYEVIFQGVRPRNFDMTEFLSSFAPDTPDSIKDNRVWLYIDKTSPIGNEDCYDKYYFDKYLDLLTKLTRSMMDVFDRKDFR